MADYSNRHPSTAHMMKMLEPNPNLRNETAKQIADDGFEFAENMVTLLPDSPEITAGLRKLMEAKDCFVRAAVFGETVDYRDR